MWKEIYSRSCQNWGLSHSSLWKRVLRPNVQRVERTWAALLITMSTSLCKNVHKTIRLTTPKDEHKKLGDGEDDKDNNEDMGTISKWRIGREPESARSRSHYRKAPKWHMSHMTNFEWNTFWERSRDVSVLLNIEGLDRTEQSEKFNINHEDQPHPRMNTPN